MDKNHTFDRRELKVLVFCKREVRAFEEEDEVVTKVSESDGTVIEARVFECLT